MENYKEKYEKALKVASQWHKDGIGDVKTIVECIFPELNESEDEKIRKQILYFLNEQRNVGGLNRPDWIAWLEKQGKQDNNEDSNILQRFSFYLYKDEPNILYLSGLYVNEECRNKGIGTKILEVADEVAKSMNCHAIRLKTKKDSNSERLYRTHGYNSLATKERDEIWLEKKTEQKSWSEEDESWFKELELMVLSFSKDDSYRKKFFAWLNSLKNRVQPQPKQEWSEKDREMLDNCLGLIQEIDSTQEEQNWLKSIKPNHWKPSEEQMEALEHFVRSIGESGYASPYDNNTKLIYSLLNALKSL